MILFFYYFKVTSILLGFIFHFYFQIFYFSDFLLSDFFQIDYTKRELGIPSFWKMLDLSCRRFLIYTCLNEGFGNAVQIKICEINYMLTFTDSSMAAKESWLRPASLHTHVLKLSAKLLDDQECVVFLNEFIVVLWNRSTI